MLILGIHTHSETGNHDSGASLVRDGEILAAVNEERMTGTKHDSSPPWNSVREVFRITKISPSIIDAIAIPSKKSSHEPFKLGTESEYPWRQEFIERFIEPFVVNKPIFFVNHHLSHASATFYTSGMSKSLILCLDGYGDHESMSVWKGENYKLVQKLAFEDKKNSLGSFYSALTESLGFSPWEGEGKTMALAAYGHPINDKEFYKIIKYSKEKSSITFKYNFNLQNKIETSKDVLYSFYRNAHLTNAEIFNSYISKFGKRDIAASGQLLLENIATSLVKNHIKKTGIHNICLGGGIFFNVKLNKKIRELQEVQNLYIHPNAGDGGLAVGAALEVCQQLTKARGNVWTPKKLEHVYLGTEYSDLEIEQALESYKLNYEKSDNVAFEAAKLISEGNIVGWFQGKMEYGPRALGNRSVLADPTNPKSVERVNLILKKRDWFIPYASSILDEYKEEYLVNSSDAPFMIISFDCKNDKKKLIPSAVHVDSSIRPQTVKKEFNPLYWELISEFYKIKKVPLVLNTSFNEHGLPIVRSPSQAIEHLLRGSVDILIIGSFIVKRELLNL